MAATASFNHVTFGDGTQVNCNVGDVNNNKYYASVDQRRNSQSISMVNSDVSNCKIGVQEIGDLADTQTGEQKRVPQGVLNQPSKKKAKESALPKSQLKNPQKSPSAGRKPKAADVKVEPTSVDARKKTDSGLVCTKPNTRSQTNARISAE